MSTDVYVYSETQQGIFDMVHEFVPEDGPNNVYVSYDWMPPGTLPLNWDEGVPEFDENNWYCNVRFSGPVEYIGNNLLSLAEMAFQGGTDIKVYPSQRQPGVTHEFPYLNRGYDENVYFTRKPDGSYLPGLPRRMYVGGADQSSWEV